MKSHAISEPRDFPRSGSSGAHHRGSSSQADSMGGDFVADYLPALLAQAHQVIAGEFHDVVGARGFSPSEWRVLATLADGQPLSITRLAQIVVMKQPTLTKVLDRMEGCGHVRRLPYQGDRRITLVSITPQGARLLRS
ncbi:MarR family winged helix-turn-helix transcriptional regulator [Ramlibacter henchirensis]|uniref:MarR family winged helix-turn-helix transcriptional regulator n=1 Tax=Ramlibacter henchirensis TaxID=204072 RepID=UPI0030B8B006